MDGDPKTKSGGGEGKKECMGEVWKKGSEEGYTHFWVGQSVPEWWLYVLILRSLEGRSVFRTPDNPYGK